MLFAIVGLVAAVRLPSSWPLRRRTSADAFELQGDLSKGVRSVRVESGVVPRRVVTAAAERCGVLGTDAPSKEAVQAMTQRINLWYRQNGYHLSRVDSCRPVRAGVLTLGSVEPRLSRQPVVMNFYAPALPASAPAEGDAPAPASRAPRLGRLRAAGDLRFAMLKWPGGGAGQAARLQAAIERARSTGLSSDESKALERAERTLRKRANLPDPSPAELAVARGELVRVDGSTRAAVVSQALGLRPGSQFCWDMQAWSQLQRCGLFDSADARAFVQPAPPPRGGLAARLRRRATSWRGGRRGAGVVGGAGESAAAAQRSGAAAATATAATTDDDGGEEGERVGEVVVSVDAVEAPAMAGRAARHRRIEPSLSVSAGGLSGELMVEDTNLMGRNQQLRLDLRRQNATHNLNARLSDPRLGRRLRYTADVFSRAPDDFSAAPADASSSATPAADGDGASSSAGASPPPTSPPPPKSSSPPPPSSSSSASQLSLSALERAAREKHSGAELRLSSDVGRTCVGLGMMAQHVPNADAASGSNDGGGRGGSSSNGGGGGGGRGGRGGGGGERGGGSLPLAAELPLKLSLYLSRGSLSKDPLSPPPPPTTARGAASGGVSTALTHSLPLAAACPRFWRAECKAVGAMPLLPTQPPRAGGGRGGRGGQREQFVAGGATEGGVGGVLEVQRRRGWRTPAQRLEAAVARALRRSLVRAKVAGSVNGAVGSASLPRYECAPLGGVGTVRGYEHGELGLTHSSASGTMELRLPLEGQPVALSLFGDVGVGFAATSPPSSPAAAAAAAAAASKPNGLGASLGCGVRYGPIRLDVAWNARGERKVHVGMAADWAD